MTKQEFLQKANLTKICQEDYDLVEFVYTWHPSISETEGKSQVAMLYINFGVKIFQDMERRAIIAKEINDRLRIIDAERNALLEKRNNL